MPSCLRQPPTRRDRPSSSSPQGCAGSDPIVDLSRFRKLVYLKFLKLPMFATREAVVLGYGDIYSHDSVMVYLTTIEQSGPWNPEAEAELQEALKEAQANGQEEEVARLQALLADGDSGGSGGGSSGAAALAPAAAAPAAAATAAAAAAPAAAAAAAAPALPPTSDGDPSWASGAEKTPNYSEYTADVDERTRAKGNLRIKIAGGFLFQVCARGRRRRSLADWLLHQARLRAKPAFHALRCLSRAF